MSNNNLQKIVNFFENIGIIVELTSLKTWEKKQCFFSNVLLDQGRLKIDPTAEIGDILHEAGHLAIFPSRLRPFCNNATISSEAAMVEVALQAGLRVTEAELDILQYCYDDQAPQGWQYAANLHLGLNGQTGFDLRLDRETGKNVHDSIAASIGSNLGHRTSVTLYYLGMIASKSSFPILKKWLNN